jgi:DNA modification methylase
VAWDKHTGIGPNDSFADAEFAWTNLKIKRNVIRYLWKGVVSEKAGEENGRRWHPTTKPQGVMRWCLNQMPQARVIVDPYMGSGSTGVAAVAMGRQFIGIEIERKYFDIACRRIEQAYAQPRLIPDEKPPAPQQTAMFAAA